MMMGRMKMRSARILKLASCLMLAAPVATMAQNQSPAPAATAASTDYQIGSGDVLEVFVWKNPELSTTVPVRPDGKITIPLVPDTVAQGRTPTELAGVLQTSLARYVQAPMVTVVVKTFAAPSNASAIHIIGGAGVPKVIPYRSGMTVLDAMIEAGGLDPFASGNRAELIRTVNGRQTKSKLRLADLMKGAKMGADVPLMPADIIRIPQRGF